MKSLLLALILFGALTATALAADFRGSCDILFDVETPLKKFQGTAACESFRVEKSGDSFRIPVIAVQVANMATGNGLRDRDMRRMFDRENHPLIFGMPGATDLVDMSQWLLSPAAADTEITFQLRIRDRVHPVSARLTDLTITPDDIRATLQFAVSLARFELNPPSFFGLMRINDDIRVTTRILLQPLP